MPKTKNTKRYIMKVKALNVRKGPSLDSEIIGVIRDLGAKKEITSKRGHFGKLAHEPGWICLDFAELSEQ